MLTLIADKVVLFSNWLWGIPIMILLVIASIYMSIRLGFFQFRKLGYILSHTLGASFKKTKEEVKGEGTLTAFQALTSAVACTVGAGNIAGVPIAIVSGGPGAVFWMWLIALMAMSLKYSEIVLAVKYRDRNDKGEWDGGPQKYITKGLHAKWLAVLFAVFLMIEVAISSMTQTNQLAASVKTSFGAPAIAVGIIVMIAAALVLIGGIKTLGTFTEKMVPIMSIFYIGGSIIIICMNITKIPAVFGMIFKYAFVPRAAAGGMLGSSIATAIRYGFARGLYSNESGVGTAAIAHSTATTDHPSRQGLWGITEVFLDTIIICSCTALVCLSSGIFNNVETRSMSGADITTLAFSAHFGKFGGYLVSISMMMFVFSTLIVLIWYGEKQAEYLFKTTKASLVYRIICILLIPVGAVGAATYLWNFLDLSLGLVVIVNVIAILLMHRDVIECHQEFFHSKEKFYLKEQAEEKKKKLS